MDRIFISGHLAVGGSDYESMDVARRYGSDHAPHWARLR
jgi:endonuclease/exonuclease/phosphatase family metal-dependent hydrolase